MHDSSIDETVSAYLDDVTQAVRQTLGGNLMGLYLHGSAVQGDFHSHLSDLDLLGVVSQSLPPAHRAELARQLPNEVRPVAAKGLEVILCQHKAVQTPQFECPFEFALSTGPQWPTVCEPAGIASDILIHMALCHRAGRALTGPHPAQIFAPVPSMLLRRALIAELHWHLENLLAPLDDPRGENAVLNAARSFHAAQTGAILSKSVGGRLWLDSYPGDCLVEAALACRKNREQGPLDKAQIRDFLHRVIELIKAL